MSNLFPAGIRKLLRIAELMVCFVVVGFTVTQSYDYVSRMKMLGAASDVAHIPMWVAHSAVLVGLVLVVLLLAGGVITGGEKPIAGGEGSNEP